MMSIVMYYPPCSFEDLHGAGERQWNENTIRKKVLCRSNERAGGCVMMMVTSEQDRRSRRENKRIKIDGYENGRSNCKCPTASRTKKAFDVYRP